MTEKYVMTTADLLSKRKSQIEDTEAMQKVEPRHAIHISLTETDGMTSGLKIIDRRGSEDYLLNLWSGLMAMFRFEALKLGYLPYGMEARGYGGPGAMWAEDVPPRGLFPEASGDRPICIKCMDADEKAGRDLRAEGYDMTLDPEKILVCGVCGWEPFQLRVQGQVEFERDGKEWEE